MDAIDRAIERKKNISSKYPDISGQTWDMFDASAKGKEIYIFGVGIAANLFWKRSKLKNDLCGILDNNNSIQGDDAGWYLYESESEGFAIQTIDSLVDQERKDFVILIASINHYESIIDQLRSVGITDYYVLLIMEANWRIKLGHDENCISDEEFTIKCEQLPINRKKIVFQADNLFCDHEKYIATAMLRLNYQIDLVFILNDMRTELPDGIRAVYSGNRRKVIYELATAGVYMTNADVPLTPVKKSGQIYIHTKHWSSVTLKKFYLDASTLSDQNEKITRWKKMFSLLDYMIVGSEFDEESCRRGFNFNGKMIYAGSPRSDCMFRYDEMHKKISKLYRIPDNRKILLYAPTYRYRIDEKGCKVPYAPDASIDFNMLRKAFMESFDNDWIVMIRLHPSVRQQSERFLISTELIDASDYPDGEELLSACDALITDYSSIMFEMAYVKKPVFLYAPDKNSYIDVEYDLLLDYDLLPFPIAETEESLIDKIKAFDKEEYERGIDKFLYEHGVNEDGSASSRAAMAIFELMNK